MSVRDDHRRRVTELENRAADMMLAALRPVVNRTAAALGQVIVAAAVPAQPRVSVDDAAMIASGWREAVDDVVLPWFGGIFHDGATAAEAQIVGIGVAVPAPDPELLDYRALQYLQEARPRFTSLGDEAWGMARAELMAGFREGEGITALRSRVRNVTGMAADAAERIARTEVIAASNLGAEARVDLMGEAAPPFKQWLSTLDGRTRPTHVAADRQVVRRKDSFLVGGASLRVPGDPGGPAREVINCRCTVLFLETADPVDIDGRGQGGDPGLAEGGPLPPRGPDPDREQGIVDLVADPDLADVDLDVPRPTNVPGGRPVGDALGAGGRVPEGLEQLVSDVAKAIDSLHGDGNLVEFLRVVTHPKSERSAGVFRSAGPSPIEISLRDAPSPMKGFTLTHEVGHWLDLDGMFGPGAFATEDRFAHPALQAVFEAMFDSDAGEALFAKRRALARMVNADPTDDYLRPQLEYLEYLLDDRELWARAYSQWVAVRSGDPDLLLGLRANRSQYPPDVPGQWSDEDFGPIAEAIDHLMVELGWRSST